MGERTRRKDAYIHTCKEIEQNKETDETASCSILFGDKHTQVYTNTFHKFSMTGFFKGQGNGFDSA